MDADLFFFACFVQKVQKALLQSDVHSKSDKSPVTVADYGMLFSPATIVSGVNVESFFLCANAHIEKLIVVGK